MSLSSIRLQVIGCTVGLVGALVAGIVAPATGLAQQRPSPAAAAPPPAPAPAPARAAEPPAAATPRPPVRGEAAAPNAPAANRAPASSDFGKIEERIKAIIESIQKSASGLNDALTEIDGGSSGDSARKIDSRIGEIMINAQAALDIAGNSGLLADRLAKLKAIVEADESRIESLGQTDDQKRAMRERISKQREVLESQTRDLSQARQKALEKINETVQLRPVIAWYARRDKVDEVTERLRPLVQSVNELASSLDILVKSTLQDPSRVPN